MQIVHRAWNRSLAASMLTLLAAGLSPSSDGALATDLGERTPRGTEILALRDDDPRHEQDEAKARHDDRDVDDEYFEAERIEELEEAIDDAQWELERDAQSWPDGRRRLQQEFLELGIRQDRLRRAGRHEEAERMQAEMDQLVRRMSAALSFYGRGPEADRQHHFRVAIENLRQAGLHEIADRLVDSVGDRLFRRHEEHRRPDERPFAQRHPDAVPRDDLERAVHELNNQVVHMHGQMRHIQLNLERLQKRLERVTNHLRQSGSPSREDRR